jgi:hypothetical protein
VYRNDDGSRCERVAHSEAPFTAGLIKCVRSGEGVGTRIGRSSQYNSQAEPVVRKTFQAAQLAGIFRSSEAVMRRMKRKRYAERHSGIIMIACSSAKEIVAGRIHGPEDFLDTCVVGISRAEAHGEAYARTLLLSALSAL